MVLKGLYKCPVCNCYFATKIDLYHHKKTHWKKTRSGKGEIAPADLFPELKPILEDYKTIRLGPYVYVLLRDGKTIYRERVNNASY